MPERTVEISPDEGVRVEARPNRIGLRGVAVALAGGALLAFLLDPDRGRSRRALAGDRIAGIARRSARQTGRFGRRVAATVRGWQARANHLGQNGEVFRDDVSLAHRVETEVFRDPEIPKGRMNVNVEQGVVVVRGTVDDPAMAERIERRILRIPGVVGVRNLLHPPGTPAPTWPGGPVVTS